MKFLWQSQLRSVAYLHEVVGFKNFVMKVLLPCCLGFPTMFIEIAVYRSKPCVLL